MAASGLRCAIHSLAARKAARGEAASSASEGVAIYSSSAAAWACRNAARLEKCGWIRHSSCHVSTTIGSNASRPMGQYRPKVSPLPSAPSENGVKPSGGYAVVCCQSCSAERWAKLAGRCMGRRKRKRQCRTRGRGWRVPHGLLVQLICVIYLRGSCIRNFLTMPAWSNMTATSRVPFSPSRGISRVTLGACNWFL